MPSKRFRFGSDDEIDRLIKEPWRLRLAGVTANRFRLQEPFEREKKNKTPTFYRTERSLPKVGYDKDVAPEYKAKCTCFIVSNRTHSARVRVFLVKKRKRKRERERGRLEKILLLSDILDTQTIDPDVKKY